MDSSYTFYKNDISNNKTNLRLLFVIVPIVAIAIFVISINQRSGSDTPDNSIAQNHKILHFTPHNIPTLSIGHYALWARDNDTAMHLLKRFNSIGQTLVSLDGEQLKSWEIEFLPSYTDFIVTIEREGDRDEVPSNLVFFEDKIAPVTKLIFKLPANQNDQDNSFILASPTDGNNKINEQSGIWFTTTDKQQPSLNISNLVEQNWTWQARIINNQGEYLIFSTFQNPATADNTNIYSDNKPGFSFPGEDFFTNLPEQFTPPLNLANGTYILQISIEPYFDNNDYTGNLVFIPILEAKIFKGAAAYQAIPLTPSEISTYLTLELN